MKKERESTVQTNRREMSILSGLRAIPDTDHGPGAVLGPSRCHSAGVLAAVGDYLKRNRRGSGRNCPETDLKPRPCSAGVAQTLRESDNIG